MKINNSFDNQSKDNFFYGWIIVIAATIIYAITEIQVLGFGIFVKPIAGDMGWTREVITRAFGSYMILLGVFGILGGILVDRIGPRLLNLFGCIMIGVGLILCSRSDSVASFYVGFSVFGGIGFAFIFVPNQTTITRWFIAKKGLALGILFAGGGLGTLIASPLLQNWIANHGWRSGYLILGILVLCLAVPASLFLKKDPSVMGLTALGKGGTESAGPIGCRDPEQSVPKIKTLDFSLPEALRTREFWTCSVAITLMFLGFFMAQVNMVPHATDKGVPPSAAALALGLASAFNAFGRIFMGGISDKIGTKHSFYICLILGATMLVYLIFVNTSWMMYIFVIFFGLANGGATPQMPRLVSELFGVGSMGSIMGVTFLVTTLGPALGPVLGGAIFDRTGSYMTAFLTGATTILIALVLIMLIKVPKKTSEF
ncbi:putative MFS transporter permease [uncultured Desulfobacterium sp.]|uniref:Putative MFS transporter permease n=1 Tax=uncultured Desulfobacterium sp. TaxID=201089 RepID=A0A445MXC5_9BACT|nr:putative MFS transporter permease [uncultured Desulfobacterium sp.]